MKNEVRKSQKKKPHRRADESPRFAYNFALRKLLKERGKSQMWLCRLLKQSRPTIAAKMSNVTVFHATDIAKIKDALQLTPDQVCEIFLTFAPKGT